MRNKWACGVLNSSFFVFSNTCFFKDGGAEREHSLDVDAPLGRITDEPAAVPSIRPKRMSWKNYYFMVKANSDVSLREENPVMKRRRIAKEWDEIDTTQKEQFMINHSAPIKEEEESILENTEVARDSEDKLPDAAKPIAKEEKAEFTVQSLGLWFTLVFRF